MRSTAAAFVALTESALGAEELAIARSVLYASLFDYPLRLAQLRQTLIESAQTPSQLLATYTGSPVLQQVVECREGFFFPRGRADLIAERRRREADSRAFLTRHARLLQLICAMPGVRLAALSGSIAHLNIDREGDLDLFIVTRGRRVWSVTVAIVLLAKLMRRRRVVCANFVVADSRLAFEPADLFTASQIIHLKPLVGTELFGTLVEANPFVRRFYPNFHTAAAAALPFRPSRALRAAGRVAEALAAPVAPLIETICRAAYRRYLARRAGTWQSPEQVRLEDDYLKLHTHSHRQSVLERFGRGIQSIA